MTSLPEAFKTALEMEQRGHDYYAGSAERLKDPVLASVMEALASDEVQHLNLIRRYYEALERTEHWPAPTAETEAPAPARARIDEIMQSSVGATAPDDSYLEIYQHAHDLELSARDYYRALGEENDDPALVKFFHFLAAVEQTHLDMLGMVLSATREALES
jgi:rubrerythrin